MLQADWYLVTWNHLDNQCFRQTGTWVPGTLQHCRVRFLPVCLNKCCVLKELTVLSFLPHSFHSHRFCGLLSRLCKRMHVTAKYLCMYNIQLKFLWEDLLVLKGLLWEVEYDNPSSQSQFCGWYFKSYLQGWYLEKNWLRREACVLWIQIVGSWFGNEVPYQQNSLLALDVLALLVMQLSLFCTGEKKLLAISTY